MIGTPVQYFEALNRPMLLLGVDRQLLLILVGLTVPIAFSASFNWLMDIIAGCLLLVGYAFGLILSRIDKQLIELYRRHIRFHHYYHALPGALASIPILRVSVPIYQGKRGLV